MSNHFRHFYSFTKRERNGIIILVILIGLLLGLDVFVLPVNINNEKFDYASFRNEIESFERFVKDNREEKNRRPETVLPNYQAENTADVNKGKLFRFDPNNTNREQWKTLGLSDYQIDNITKYLEKGGQFYEPEDFQKIYGIDEQMYDKLKDYIRIEKIEEEKNNFTQNVKEKEDKNEEPTVDVVDLNSADTTQFMLVNGIGRTYAERISKYRDLLGGFRKIEQLKEVYGINDSVYSYIKDNFVIDTTLCESINLNNADFSELIRHPYLNEYHTKSILKYRDIKDKKISDVEELLENNILPRKTYLKVAGYLNCD
ncbi:MAG: helix-hairpin-helix domain-containing protein [Bacteroidales bacterium]